jgi:hypothetical protein
MEYQLQDNARSLGGTMEKSVFERFIEKRSQMFPHKLRHLGISFLLAGFFIFMMIIILLKYPLHIAVITGNKSLVEQALKFDKSGINEYSGLGNTVIIYAMDGKNTEIIKLLADNGANLNLMELDEGRYPLHLAIEKNDSRMIELLLECGADPYLRIGGYGKTPEEYAIKMGRPELAKQILDWKQKNGNQWYFGIISKRR